MTGTCPQCGYHATPNEDAQCGFRMGNLDRAVRMYRIAINSPKANCRQVMAEVAGNRSALEGLMRDYRATECDACYIWAKGPLCEQHAEFLEKMKVEA